MFNMIVNLFLGTFFIEISHQECMDPFTLVDESCYLFECSDRQMGMADSWMEAKLRCQLMNGWLAELESLKSMRKLHKFMHIDGISAGSRDNTWYVGASFNTSVGRYTWLSGGMPNSTSWAPEEPQKDVGQCVVMSWMPNNTRKAHLFTEDCGTTSCYICQKNTEDIPRGEHLDDIDTSELWNHILNLFELPFKSRTQPRGTNRYIYILENEKIPEVKHMPIIVPVIPNIIEDLGDIVNIPRGESNIPMPFDDDAIEAKYILSKIFTDRSHNAKELLKYVINAKDHINEYMFIDVLGKVVKVKSKKDKEEKSQKGSTKKKMSTEEKNDLDGFVTPQIYESFPKRFTNITKGKGRKKRSSHRECEHQNIVDKRLNGNEWKMSYWREDKDLNIFHCNWHTYNKVKNLFEGLEDGHRVIKYPMEEYNHGEMFYYFHNQLLIRYDLERLSNGLAPVEALNKWSHDYVIPENYYPLVSSGGPRCGRHDTGIFHEKGGGSRKNIEDAIRSQIMLVKRYGEVLTGYNLTDNRGVSLLGCNLEHDGGGKCPSHKRYEGAIHNLGHNILSRMKCATSNSNKRGVVSQLDTSARDPIFYRWHMYLEEVFRMHKNTLSAYNYKKLTLSKVEVTDVKVQSVFGNENELYTFMGLEKTIYKNVGCVTQDRLNNRPFRYEIKVRYDGYKDNRVNIRIFMAPVKDHMNRTLKFEDQRKSWALMDRFSYVLQRGENLIDRSSCDSSISVRPLMTTEEIRERINKKFKKSSDSKKDECPKGFNRVGAQCLQFVSHNRYKETYGNAQHKCQQRNARLVTVLNQKRLTNEIRKIEGFNGKNFWVGARKSVSKKDPKWIWTNMAKVDDGDYPDILKIDYGLGHNCLAWSDSKQHFTVRKCGERLQFICEAVIQDCRDKDSLCHKWRKNCNKEKWVTKICPKTCGKCVSVQPYCTPHPDCVFPFVTKTGRKPQRSCTMTGIDYAVCRTTEYPDSTTIEHRCTGVCGNTGSHPTRHDSEDVDPNVCRPHKSCTFPFTYKNVEYTACTDVDEQFFWCSNKQDEDGHHIRQKWERCRGMCGLLKNNIEQAEERMKDNKMETTLLVKNNLARPLPCGPKKPPATCGDMGGKCYTSCDSSQTSIGTCSQWCYCCATNCQTSSWCSWKGGYCARNKESCQGTYIGCEGKGCKCCLPKRHKDYGGPTENIWEENQCQSLEAKNNVTAEDCMQNCDMLGDCNALNYQISSHNCQILDCPADPLPKPALRNDTYIGYYKKVALPVCSTTCVGLDSGRNGMCSSLLKSLEINIKQEESESCQDSCVCMVPKECRDLMEDCRLLKYRCELEPKLLILCPKTCMSCPIAPSPISTPSPITKTDCEDSTDLCATLQHLCLDDDEVRKMCPETCGSCKNVTPDDLYPYYEYELNTNEIPSIDVAPDDLYPEYDYELNTNENPSIDDCADTDPDCSKLLDQCTDPEVKIMCPKTCDSCGNVIIDDLYQYEDNELETSEMLIINRKKRSHSTINCADKDPDCYQIRESCSDPEVKILCPKTCDSCTNENINDLYKYEVNELGTTEMPAISGCADKDPLCDTYREYCNDPDIEELCPETCDSAKYCDCSDISIRCLDLKDFCHKPGVMKRCPITCDSCDEIDELDSVHNPVFAESTDCKPHANCIFPYIYKGHIYKECSNVDWDVHWCSIKQDSQGYHIEGQFVDCSKECEYMKCTQHKACTFPFTYKQTTYINCTEEDATYFWCSSKQDENGFHIRGHWKPCRGECEEVPRDDPSSRTAAAVATAATAVPAPRSTHIDIEGRQWNHGPRKSSGSEYQIEKAAFNNDICKNRAIHTFKSLEGCQGICSRERGCNAFNYSPKVQICQIYECPMPVPKPTLTQTSYHRHYAFVGYKKRKKISYSKPSDTIWSTSQAEMINNFASLNIAKCKAQCNNDPECNAIYHMNSSPEICLTIKCQVPIPRPLERNTEFLSYQKIINYKSSENETQDILDNHTPLYNYVEDKGKYWQTNGPLAPCHMLSTHFEQGVLKCTALCDNNAACNAINYKTSSPTSCALIRCTVPVDDPVKSNKDFIGFQQQSLNYKKFSEEYAAGWNTPGNCTVIGKYNGLGVKQCQAYCNQDTACNAVNFFKMQKPTECRLLSCVEPIPSPEQNLPGLVGFKHLTNCFDLTTGCSKLPGIKDNCGRHPYLRNNCPRACGICKGDCWDTDMLCPKWQQLGLCSTDSYVQKRCPKTCFNCKGIKSDEKLPCQCGLPQHLLIPKGTPEGMPFQLFVYVSAYQNKEGQSKDKSMCDDVECSDLCARKFNCLGYNDESMGFPFDRPLPKLGPAEMNSIDDLDNMLRNAKTIGVNIFHSTESTAQSDDYKCHYEDLDDKLKMNFEDEL